MESSAVWGLHEEPPAGVVARRWEGMEERRSVHHTHRSSAGKLSLLAALDVDVSKLNFSVFVVFSYSAGLRIPQSYILRVWTSLHLTSVLGTLAAFIFFLSTFLVFRMHSAQLVFLQAKARGRSVVCIFLISVRTLHICSFLVPLFLYCICETDLIRILPKTEKVLVCITWLLSCNLSAKHDTRQVIMA